MADSQQTMTDLIDRPLEIKAGEAPGSFEGYGAIFGNLDRDGDIVARGAFADSLQAHTPALLWQHNAKEPIGRFDVVREDEKGLYVKGRLSMQGRGLEAYELLKMGALDGLSIGFVTKEASRDAASGSRTIKRADLMEISLVTFPANELARVSSVKGLGQQALPDSPRAFEHFLRGSGFSRTQAKTITSKGFRGIDMNTYDEHAIADMVRHLKTRQDAMEGKALKNAAYLFPGDETSGMLSRPTSNTDNWLFPGLPKGRTTFKVTPPHRLADFQCEVIYWAWTGRRYEERQIYLEQNEQSSQLSRTMDTPSEDPFNIFDMDDWRTAGGRMVANLSTRFNLVYTRSRKPVPQGAARTREPFVISVS